MCGHFLVHSWNCRALTEAQGFTIVMCVCIVILAAMVMSTWNNLLALFNVFS